MDFPVFILCVVLIGSISLHIKSYFRYLSRQEEKEEVIIRARNAYLDKLRSKLERLAEISFSSVQGLIAEVERSIFMSSVSQIIRRGQFDATRTPFNSIAAELIELKRFYENHLEPGQETSLSMVAVLEQLVMIIRAVREAERYTLDINGKTIVKPGDILTHKENEERILGSLDDLIAQYS